MRLNMTYHAKVERFDRLAILVEKIGVGEIVLEKPDDRYPNTIRCITTTGLVLVKSTSTGKLITGYMATIDQLHAIFAGTHIPNSIFFRVKMNNKKFQHLLK